MDLSRPSSKTAGRPSVASACYLCCAVAAVAGVDTKVAGHDVPGVEAGELRGPFPRASFPRPPASRETCSARTPGRSICPGPAPPIPEGRDSLSMYI